MFNFEDNIGVLVLKAIASEKWFLFVKEFSKSDNLEQSFGIKHSILQITYGFWYSRDSSQKRPLVIKEFF